MTQLEKRMLMLELMHQMIVDMGDENVYEKWIHWMPDQPTKEDLEDIAEDKNEFADTVKYFAQLIK